MATPSYGPSSTSGDFQNLGLLVQGKEAGCFDRLSQFPDFGRLARLHFCTDRARPLAPYLRMAGVEPKRPNAFGSMSNPLVCPEEAYRVLRFDAINLAELKLNPAKFAL